MKPLVLMYKGCLSCRSVLEEVNVRSNLALAQKRFLYELDGGEAELEEEYLKMSAQVVRPSS